MSDSLTVSRLFAYQTKRQIFIKVNANSTDNTESLEQRLIEGLSDRPKMHKTKYNVSRTSVEMLTNNNIDDRMNKTAQVTQ